MATKASKTMSPEDFAKYMKRHSQVQNSFGWIDKRVSHQRMDSLMCKVLKDLGYGDGVKVFKEAPKWYA